MLNAGEIMSAYRFSGYWKDVGTIRSLWDANMDLLTSDSSFDLYDDSWPIYARSPVRPPHITGPEAEIRHCLVTGGCQVYGKLSDSVLFHSVTVERGATVHASILMPGAVVKAGARVEYAILAENAVVEENAVVGESADENGNIPEITVVADHMRVAAEKGESNV
jgi:glucose-1-phosphate adenylyltransferase